MTAIITHALQYLHACTCIHELTFTVCCIPDVATGTDTVIPQRRTAACVSLASNGSPVNAVTRAYVNIWIRLKKSESDRVVYPVGECMHFAPSIMLTGGNGHIRVVEFTTQGNKQLVLKSRSSEGIFQNKS